MISTTYLLAHHIPSSLVISLPILGQPWVSLSCPSRLSRLSRDCLRELASGSVAAGAYRRKPPELAPPGSAPSALPARRASRPEGRGLRALQVGSSTSRTPEARACTSLRRMLIYAVAPGDWSIVQAKIQAGEYFNHTRILLESDIPCGLIL